jgi:hypothetical protein
MKKMTTSTLPRGASWVRYAVVLGTGLALLTTEDFAIAQIQLPTGTNQTQYSQASTNIPDGTPLKIRINQTISSADAKVGQTVDFEVLDEVKVADTVVIPKGGLALATVTVAEPKKSMGRGGKLDVNIDHAKLVNGDKVPLRAVKENEGGGHVGAMTAGIVATSIVFFPAAPLFLFMKGKDITIPKGTEVTAFVNGDYSIDFAKIRPAVVPLQPAVAEATVTINSTPAGADVTIDNKFVGNTPLTLRLGAGDHTIKMEKNGFTTWQRSVFVTGGSNLNLSPALEKTR